MANKGNLLLKLKLVRNIVAVIILEVIVCTFCWTNISASMSGAGFHNPLCNQLHSRHMCCVDVTIKVIWFDKKKRTFVLTGCREYLYISVCIWYEDSFTQMKQSNRHKVTLRAVLEMLFVCLSSLRRHARFSVCAKGIVASHKLYYQRMWAEHSGEQISEGGQLYHSILQHSSSTANRNKYTNVT